MKNRRQPFQNYDRYALGLMAFQSGKQLYGYNCSFPPRLMT